MFGISLFQLCNLVVVVVVALSSVEVEGFFLHHHTALAAQPSKKRIVRSKYDDDKQHYSDDGHWRYSHNEPLILISAGTNNIIDDDDDDDDDNNSKKYNVEAALVPLVWEGLEESASRPVLNLSGRDSSPEETDDGSDTASTADWDQGQLWEVTKQGLLDRGLTNDLEEDGFLDQCPQLLRLSPTMVLESADLILKDYGMEYLQKEPKLLSYKANQIEYGLEFMSTMMMMDATAACKASPALLMSGIEGGIQEQAVQAALAAAGKATSQANQKIAGDAMATIQSLKNKKNPPGLS